MDAIYRTEAVNRTGADGVSAVRDGLSVAVVSPLGPDPDAAATNPEQLLALAWATCLNGTAQVIVNGARRTAVRVEAALHPAPAGVGYEFHVDAHLSVEGASAAEASEVLAAAHARCPVSKLLAGAATVRTHVEAYPPAD